MNKIKKRHQYPMDKVFVYYQLVANFIHALVLSLLNDVLLKHNKEMPFSVMMVDNLFSFFIPFLCCTIYFMYKKYKIDDKSSLYHIALINALIYSVYIILSIKNQFFIINLITFVIVSTVCAKIILPKTEYYLKNKYKREKMIARQNKFKEPSNINIFGQWIMTNLGRLKLSKTEQNNHVKYPKLMVILVYSQVGGSVGAVLTILGMTGYLVFASFAWGITDVVFRDMNTGVFIFSYVVMSFFVLLIGGIVGAIPAIFTGIYIAVFKIYLRNIWGYIHISLAGAMFSMLIFRDWWMALIGGLASLIIGSIILPKNEYDSSRDW